MARSLSLCRYGQWLLLLALLCPPGQAQADNQQDALLMPGASRSLLLDITRAGQRLVAVGERGHVLYSDDNGSTWQQSQVPTRQMLTAVTFKSARRGWAVGHDGLVLASIDGGENWVIQRDGLADQASLNQSTLARLRARQAALVQSAEEEGNPLHWRELQQQREELALDLEDAEFTMSQPVHTAPLLDVYFLDDQRGFAVGAFNSFLATSDGGNQWRSIRASLENPGEYHLNGITGDGDQRLWIAGEGGLLFHSSDAGDSWRTLASPYDGSFFGIACSPDGQVVLAYGLRGHAYYSRDAGESWWPSRLESRRSLAGGAFLTDRQVVLVGDVGGVYQSLDGGVSFTTQSLDKRVNLSAVIKTGQRALVVGQGGVHAVRLGTGTP